jgi:hypothetical protein
VKIKGGPSVISNNNYQDQINSIIGRIGARILNARCTARIFAAVAGNVINNWSGASAIKKKVTSPLKFLLTKIPRSNKDKISAPAGSIPADAARLITLLAVMFNESHPVIPPDEAAEKDSSIKAFLENLDFGEIMEMAEKSDPYILKSLQSFNEEIWKYPAKVGAFIATVIAIMNTAVKSSREILLPIEQAIGPDLLADMVLSVIRGLDGSQTAKLINTVSEVIRRLHTGSLLLGKGGKPLMQHYLTDLFKKCLSGLDPGLMRKLHIIFSEDRLSIANAVSDALTDNPDITLSYIASLGSVQNSSIRAKSRKLRIYEEIDQTGFNAAIRESISDLDTYEIAELVNGLCRVLNRFHSIKPDILSSLACGIADSIDSGEIEKTLKWLIPDLVQAFKPLSPVVMPELIRGLSEMINPDGVYQGSEQAEALKELKATLSLATGGEK